MSRQSLKNIHRMIAQAQTAAPVADQFVADLEMTIEKEFAKEKREPSRKYKPSSMQCIRNMYYQIVGADIDEDRVSASLVGILQTGTDRHAHIQEAVTKMKEHNIDCEYIDVEDFIKIRNLDYLEIVERDGYEVKLYHKDLNLSFLCDGIIKYKNRYYILEIKTETVYKWTSRKEVAKEHYTQCAAYSVSFGIDEVLVLYENRDVSSKKAYTMTVTDEMRNELVLSKIEECDNYVEQKMTPPKPADISKKICQYCSYQTQCKKDGL